MGTVLQCFVASLALLAVSRADLVGPPDYRSMNWGIKASNLAEAEREAAGNVVVPVAVVDTGLDATHPYLGAPTLGGWDFVMNSAKTNDEHGHGTHVTGIIEMVAGKHVSVMPIKYYSDANPAQLNVKNTIKAINWAVDHGVKVINYSGGGPEFVEDEYLALRRAEDKGILVVAAAGNEHSNVDLTENYYYPGAYRLSNIVVVAGIDEEGNATSTTNWGEKRVDVAAPGEDIFSTLPNNKFGTRSGTSQATAFVSGIAVLAWSQNPELTVPQIRKILVESVHKFDQLEHKVASHGRIDAAMAVEAARRSK